MTEDLLLVDDDVGAIHLLDMVLQGVGRHRFAMSGQEALRLARSVRPDMMLLDAEMPGLDGFAVLREMRGDPGLQHVPVIMVTGRQDLEALSFGFGAEDFILKPVDSGRLLARVAARLRESGARHSLQRLALLDPLTELPNPAHFRDTLEREFVRATEAHMAISLVLLSIDGLAELHRPGLARQWQMIIRSAAWVLRDTVRQPADFVAHLGLGEFALLLPDTDHAGAQQLLARIHSALQQLELDPGTGAAPFALAARTGIASSCNAGCARRPRTIATPAGADAGRLLLAAQLALQAARQEGRGSVRERERLKIPNGLP